MAAEVNANDPRVRRSRKLLQQAIVELMGEKGFQAISVQDIAERATLNRATFYAHFADKYDLLDSIVREGFEQSLANNVPATSAFTTKTLRTLCRTVCEFLAQVQDHCKPRDRHFDPLLEKATQEVLHGFIMGRLQETPAPDLPERVPLDTVAAVMSWAIFGAGIQWSRGTRVRAADEVAAQVVAVLTGGVPAAMPEPVTGRLQDQSA